MSRSDRQHADVFKREEMLLVHSALIDGHLTFFKEPVLSARASAPAEEKGTLVLEALTATKYGPGGRMAADMKRLTPLLKAAGVRSYRQFCRGAKLCSIRRAGKRVKVVPYRQEKGGRFTPITDKTIELTGPTALELGEAVEQALCRAD